MSCGTFAGDALVTYSFIALLLQISCTVHAVRGIGWVIHNTERKELVAIEIEKVCDAGARDAKLCTSKVAILVCEPNHDESDVAAYSRILE